MSRHLRRVRKPRGYVIIGRAAFLKHGCRRVPQTMEGTARVVDGDTIEVKDQNIRLWGIDAPEMAQRCTEDGVLYLCGLDAPHALARRIMRKLVSCTRRDTDRYGRVVALCNVEDGTDKAGPRRGWRSF